MTLSFVLLTTIDAKVYLKITMFTTQKQQSKVGMLVITNNNMKRIGKHTQIHTHPQISWFHFTQIMQTKVRKVINFFTISKAANNAWSAF